MKYKAVRGLTMARDVICNANIVKDMIKKYKNITIPTNQRNFEWTCVEIQTFLNDLYQSFQLQEEFYIGMFILLANGEDMVSVWDGQQRLVTLYLFIITLLHKYHEYTQTANNVDEEWYNLEYNVIALPRGYMNDSDKLVAKANNWGHISKVKYIVEDVITGTILNDLVNRKWRSYKDFLKFENKRYVCTRCSGDFHSKTLAEKHIIYTCTKIDNCEHEILKKYHDLGNNKLFSCVVTVNEIINDWLMDGTKLKELYTYIESKKLCCDIEICRNIQTASRRFEQLNFRGKPVSLLTIAKNHFLSQTEDVIDRNSISNYFETLNKRPDKTQWIEIDDKFLFELSIRIYYEMFEVSTSFIQLFNKCVNDKSFNFDSLCIITELIGKIIDLVYPYRNLFPNKSIKISLQYIIIPLGHKFFSQSYIVKLIDIVSSHIVRIKILKKRHPDYSFYKFSVPICNLVSQSYNNELSEDACLQSLKGILWKSVIEYKSSSFVEYERKLRELPEKFKNSKSIVYTILFYYAYKSQPDIIKCEQEFDVDCINDLNTIKFRIGNCTLTEKRNKPRVKRISTFSEKIANEYKGSLLDMNRNIASYFGRKTSFDINCVDAREKFITKYLFSTTESLLNPNQHQW